MYAQNHYLDSFLKSTQLNMEIPSSSDLTIRPYNISDADDLLIYGGDAKVMRFTTKDPFKTKEEALSFIEEYCIPHPYCRSICLNDRSIGFLFVKPESGVDQCRAEVGYMLSPKYWGQGIVAKALKMAIVEAFEKFPHVERMQARFESENKASGRVLEKVGFIKEGLLRKYMINKGEVRDLFIFSLLSTDPIL